MCRLSKAVAFTAVTLLWSAVGHAQGRGLIFASPDSLRRLPQAVPPYSGSVLPPAVDLSGSFPPPGDQKRQNSCVAWAVAYALRTYEAGVDERLPFLTPGGGILPERVFSPAFIYNQINHGRDGGANYEDALNLVHSRGAATFATMPYNSEDYRALPGASARTEAMRYRIDYWRPLSTYSIIDLKAQINAGYPVLFGAMVDSGFFAGPPNATWSTSLGPLLGGHAMVLVGYDDRRQAFRLVNSWGTTWADHGYAWISYAYFPIVAREAYIVKPAIPGTVFALGEEDLPRVDANGMTVSDTSRNLAAFILPIQGSPSRFSVLDVAPVRDSIDGSKRHVFVFAGRAAVPAGAGRVFRILLRVLQDSLGKPVESSAAGFRSPSGSAIAFTPSEQISAGRTTDSQWSVALPTSALRIQSSGANRPLIAEVTLLIDDFGVRSVRRGFQLPDSRPVVP